MKSLKYIATLLVAAMALGACHQYDAPKTHDYVEPNSSEEWQTTYTIHQFLDKFLTKTGNEEKYPPRARSHKDNSVTQENLGLFSVDDIPADTTIVGNDTIVDMVVIKGRIVSSDVAGNIYKTIYIQDVAHPEQGLKISIDAGSISGILPIGQVIAIHCNGLAIGKYANMAQLGIPFFNNAKEGLDSESKRGWEIGRIPLPIFMQHIQLIGKPEPEKIVVNEMEVDAFPSINADYKTIAQWAGRLVRIDGLYFSGEGVDYGNPVDLSEEERIFAPSTDGIGYPQTRILRSTKDASKRTAIGTSEYAKFANAPLPVSSYDGSITGFVSYYWDKGKNDPDSAAWTLVLRSLDDVQLKDEDGEVWRADEVFYPKY